MNTQQSPSISSQSQITSLPGSGDLLKRSWQIYKERISVLLGIMILPVFVVLFATLLLIGIKQLFQLSLVWLLGIIILALSAIILILWSGVALLYVVKEREAKIGLKESFTKARPKIISYLWISLLAGFITLIGFLLFIIPGIIFAVWFSLAVYILVAEDLTGMKALSRSKQLVSGFWWKVFWRFLIIGLIAIIFSLIISLFEELIGIPQEISISSIILSLFFTPFAATYTFLIYEDLRKIKAGAFA
jgi:hypothetical protein